MCQNKQNVDECMVIHCTFSLLLCTCQNWKVELRCECVRSRLCLHLSVYFLHVGVLLCLFPWGSKDGPQQLQAFLLFTWQPQEESVSFPVIPAQVHDLMFIVSDWPRRDYKPVSAPITVAKGLLRSDGPETLPTWNENGASVVPSKEDGSVVGRGTGEGCWAGKATGILLRSGAGEARSAR